MLFLKLERSPHHCSPESGFIDKCTALDSPDSMLTSGSPICTWAPKPQLEERDALVVTFQVLVTLVSTVDKKYRDSLL